MKECMFPDFWDLCLLYTDVQKIYDRLTHSLVVSENLEMV
jgi:hypothetical protein